MTLSPGTADESWEVFARHDPAHPLRHVGRVDATNVDDAMVFAKTLYEEWRWVDMFIVRKVDIVTVVRPE